MKICIISPNFDSEDGIAKYSHELYKSLSNTEHKILVLSSGSKPHSIPTNNYHQLGFFAWDIVKSLAFISKQNPDIIHLQYNIPAYGFLSLNIWMLLLIAKKLTPTKIVITLHEVKRELDLLQKAGKYYFKCMSLICDIFFVHTSQAKELLKKSCDVKLPIIVIPHFIIPPLPFLSAPQNALNNMFTITQTGFIHVDKGIKYLIESIYLLKKNNPEILKQINVVIAGKVRTRSGIFKIFEKKDTEYQKSLHHLVHKYNLEKYIHFEGYLSSKKLHELLTNSYIFILPYTNVEQSGVLHRLLSYNKPIIASKLGGLGETLKQAGILVDVGDSRSIAGQIVSLISDKSYYQNTITKYNALFNGLNIKSITSQLISEYKSALKPHET